MTLEARTMEYVGSFGYPAPGVEEVSDDGIELVMERVECPVMMADLGRRPWTIRRQGQLLASLHRRLHQLPAPDWVADAPFGHGDRLLHLDLHPINVMLSDQGPVMIDWTNAVRGDPLSDVAITWTAVRSLGRPVSGQFGLWPVRGLKCATGDVDTRDVEAPSLPDDERERVTSLRRLGLLDTGPEERFDRITRTARRLFDVDTAMVTLVDTDRTWCKSSSGPDGLDAPRHHACCARTILNRDGQVLVVPDTLGDERFADEPGVVAARTFRFYAGAPIAGPDGSILGALCLTDRGPRSLDADQLASLRDLADMIEREIAVSRLAVDDELTGLANRRGFLMMANQALAFCERQRVSALVVVADIDGLTSVNDRFGHEAGDRLLRHAATAMADAFRASDVVGRFGGDEFAAVLTSYSGEPSWAGKRLDTGVQACNDQMTGSPVRLSMAVGSTRFDPDDPELLEALLNRADTAMHADKLYRRQLAEHRDPA